MKKKKKSEFATLAETMAETLETMAAKMKLF